MELTAWQDHDDTLAVAATDVTAANRWLCEIAGGKQVNEAECRFAPHARSLRS